MGRPEVDRVRDAVQCIGRVARGRRGLEVAETPTSSCRGVMLVGQHQSQRVLVVPAEMPLNLRERVREGEEMGRVGSAVLSIERTASGSTISAPKK